MDQICVSCLSQNRKLSVIKPKYWNLFRWVVNKQKMNSNLRICWECEAHIRRFYLFIERTQENARILENCLDFNELKCQSCLSTVTFADSSAMDASMIVKDDDETYIKMEYYEDSEDCFKIDPIPENNFRLDDATKGENFDSEQIFKIENDSMECSSEIETNICLEEEGNRTNDMDKSQVMQQIPTVSNHVDMWTVEMVSEEQLWEWRREDENAEKYQRLLLKCTTCLIAFNYQKQLDTHNSKHHYEALGAHKCDICKTRFRTDILVKEHRKQHFMLYKCFICQFTSRCFNIFNMHVIHEHTEASMKCNLCNAVFKTRSQLQYHKTKHAASHKCKYCDRVFRLKASVYLHIAKKHANLPEERCHICKKVYKDKYALKTHLTNVHFEAKDTYYCTECDIHFKSASIYKNHFSKSIKHLKSEDLKYECEKCGRLFVSEKLRQVHHERIHLKKGQFVCDKCPKSYCTRRGLKLHKSHKHDVNYVEPERNKVCDVCGKAFSSKIILMSHIRTHTGERPYKCKQCPSTFAHSGAFYTHKKLVHDKQKRKLYKKGETL